MTRDSVWIRPATHTDLGHIVRLESKLFEEDAGTHDPFADVTWPQRAGAADATSLIESPTSIVLLAIVSEAVVGLLMAYAAPSFDTRLPVTSAILRTLYVDSSRRSEGVGSLLMDAFMVWAKQQGCSEAQVNHYSENTAAGRFYEAHGFAPRSLQRTLTL